MPTQNKYDRLLQNTEQDLREVCSCIANREGTPTLENIQELLGAVEMFKTARLSHQVYEDATKGN